MTPGAFYRRLRITSQQRLLHQTDRLDSLCLCGVHVACLASRLSLTDQLRRIATPGLGAGERTRCLHVLLSTARSLDILLGAPRGLHVLLSTARRLRRLAARPLAALLRAPRRLHDLLRTPRRPHTLRAA